MNVFPRCMVNRAPLITYHGYVAPCCWIPYDKEIKYIDESTRINPFFRDDFNLYNNKFKDIIESDEWKEMLFSIIEDTPTRCQKQCGYFNVVNNKILESNNSVPKVKLSDNKKAYSSTDKNIFLRNINFDKSNLQLETSSRCSLRCPYCSRTTKAGTGFYYKSDLSLEIMDDVLNYKSWSKVDDSGRLGDPIFYKHFINMLDILEKSNVQKYKIHTAATGKGVQWWQSIVDKLVRINDSGTEIILIFGIDGLEDTSHIHRVNQDWNEITTAMRMCADAGLHTIWQFIPFSHNEYQIEEVKRLASEWGVELFFTLSNRFKGPNDPMLPKDASLHSLVC